MPVDPRKAAATIRRVEKLLDEVGRDPTSERIHHFRTSVRRLESLLAAAGIPDSKQQTRLLRDLGKLRRRAGRARDAEIQAAALSGLQVGAASAQKRSLLDWLQRRRQAAQQSLLQSAGGKRGLRLRRRLRQFGRDFTPQSIAMHLPALPGEPLHRANLHEFRKAAKQIRYLAELFPSTAKVRAVTARLKQMQDAIGEWHDWAELARRAEKLNHAGTDSPLYAALRNITCARLEQALLVAAECRAALQPSVDVPRRPPASALAPSSVRRRVSA